MEMLDLMLVCLLFDIDKDEFSLVAFIHNCHTNQRATLVISARLHIVLIVLRIAMISMFITNLGLVHLTE